MELKGSSRYGITGRGGPRVTPFGGFDSSGNSNYLNHLIRMWDKSSFPGFIQDLIDKLMEEKILVKMPFQVSVNAYDTPQQGMIVSNSLDI